MIRETTKLVYPLESYAHATTRFTPTEELAAWNETTVPTSALRSPTLPYALDILAVAARLIICLVAIGGGIWAAANGNHFIAILAAFGCASIVYALLSPRRVDTRTSRIYYKRLGPLFLRFWGDAETDAAHAGHWAGVDAFQHEERVKRLTKEAMEML